METFLEIFIKAVPLTIAIAIGGGFAAWVVILEFRNIAKLNSEEEQRVRDIQDADRDAYVNLLKEQNDTKQKMIDSLLKTNAYLHHRLGITIDEAPHSETDDQS